MKKIFLTLTTLLFATQAQADFVQGRVRISADSTMSASFGDGIFAGVTQAKTHELYTDGKGITGYTISLSNNKIQLSVINTQQTRCGTLITAESLNTNKPDALHYKLTLASDYGDYDETSSCRGTQIRWNAQLQAVGGIDGKNSTLNLEGVPEYYILTQ